MNCALPPIPALILRLKHTLSNEDFYNHPYGQRILAMSWPELVRSNRDLREIFVELLAKALRHPASNAERNFASGVKFRQCTADSSISYPYHETLGDFFVEYKFESFL